MNGYNPIRHDCKRDGCFNVVERPKIEKFCHCFPGRINFGDGDGKVEINGHLLFLEWKKCPMPLPTGQRIMYERTTRGKNITCVCVAGNPETMEITHMAQFFDGKFKDWWPATFDAVCEKFKKWSDWAQTHTANWREAEQPR